MRVLVSVSVPILSMVGALALLLPGCASIQAKSDFDREANFAAYRSFTWIAAEPLMSAPPEVSPLASGRIQRAITATLQAEGYRYEANPARADIAIGFTLGARDKVRVDTSTYPVGFRGPHRWGVAYYQDVDVRQYTQGRLAIDMFDTKLKRPVWHGYATKNLSSSDRKNAEQLILEAVTAILGGFPPP
jgi:hypothetical protein